METNKIIPVSLLGLSKNQLRKQTEANLETLIQLKDKQDELLTHLKNQTETIQNMNNIIQEKDEKLFLTKQEALQLTDNFKKSESTLSRIRTELFFWLRQCPVWSGKW